MEINLERDLKIRMFRNSLADEDKRKEFDAIVADLSAGKSSKKNESEEHRDFLQVCKDKMLVDFMVFSSDGRIKPTCRESTSYISLAMMNMKWILGEEEAPVSLAVLEKEVREIEKHNRELFLRKLSRMESAE